MEKRWPIPVGLEPGRTESWSCQHKAGHRAATENLRTEPTLKTAELRERKVSRGPMIGSVALDPAVPEASLPGSSALRTRAGSF